MHNWHKTYLSTVTTQHSARQRHVRRLLMRVKAPRRAGAQGAYRVWVRRVGAQRAQFQQACLTRIG